MALLGLAPLAMGLWLLPAVLRGAPDNDADDEALREQRAERRTHSRMLAVALVTIANGGDNVAVYIPLFGKDTGSIPLHAAVFLVLTAVWCGLGYLLVNNRWIGERVGHYGPIVLPFVLIALGLYLLSDARSLLQPAAR